MSDQNHEHDDLCYFAEHSLDEYLEQVRAHIVSHGQHIVGVLGSPGFCYTIGLLPEFGFELIVFGLPHEVATIILNDIAASMRKGAPLEFDTPDARFSNLPVLFRRSGPQAQEFNGCARLHFGGDVPMVQMILSDRAGRFPEEAGYDHAYMDPKQPVLPRSH